MKLDQISTEQFLEGIRSGNTVLLSRAITLLESKRKEHRDKADALLQACLPYSGGALRVGVTGVPGAGKSTFIEQLGQQIVSTGRKLAVLAVDPSSKRSKGSILGDKTRMEQLSGDAHVFIRPSPAGDTLGGVAGSTRESIVLLEAAGYDFIMVETVGVGQSEVAVHSMTDVFILLLISGAGDELQGIKRGIMEMADIIAVNKADGDNLEKAWATRQDFHRALHLFAAAESGWIAPVETCSALTGDGLDTIWQHILDFEKSTRASGYFMIQRQQQRLAWMHEALQEAIQISLAERFHSEWHDLETAVLAGQMVPSLAARTLMNRYFHQ